MKYKLYDTIKIISSKYPGIPVQTTGVIVSVYDTAGGYDENMYLIECFDDENNTIGIELFMENEITFR